MVFVLRNYPECIYGQASRNAVPTYLKHKKSGQAFIRVASETVYLSRHNSPESKKKYRRICAELEAQSPTASVAKENR